MPSAKNQKAPKQYPPCNRAFALRMMHPTQYVEGRVSPLDRALKPIRDSFKRSGKNKRAKSKDSQNMSNAHSSYKNSSGDEVDTSYELASPDEHLDYDRHFNDIMTSSGRQVRHTFDDKTTKKLRETNENKSNKYSFNGMLYEGMENIDEEDELDMSQSMDHESENSLENTRFHHDNDRYPQNSINKSREEKSYESKHERREIHVDKQKHYVSNDGDIYFITPNGEYVKMREKKKIIDRKENEETCRTERFGKRLSLLCHMLAEKYPEDFHILELLVELQVSNEKREEDMNRKVFNLQEKVDRMEKRLCSIEQLSLPGLQKILFPLAIAAEALSDGLKTSLKASDDAMQSKTNENITATEDEDRVFTATDKKDISYIIDESVDSMKNDEDSQDTEYISTDGQYDKVISQKNGHLETQTLRERQSELQLNHFVTKTDLNEDNCQCSSDSMEKHALIEQKLDLKEVNELCEPVLTKEYGTVIQQPEFATAASDVLCKQISDVQEKVVVHEERISSGEEQDANEFFSATEKQEIRVINSCLEDNDINRKHSYLEKDDVNCKHKDNSSISVDGKDCCSKQEISNANHDGTELIQEQYDSSNININNIAKLSIAEFQEIEPEANVDNEKSHNEPNDRNSRIEMIVDDQQSVEEPPARNDKKVEIESKNHELPTAHATNSSSHKEKKFKITNETSV